jgi:hypothetical protein
MSIHRFSIRNTGNIPVEYTMVLELEEDYLGEAGGSVTIC